MSSCTYVHSFYLLFPLYGITQETDIFIVFSLFVVSVTFSNPKCSVMLICITTNSGQLETLYG